jgi:hypothetical protein
MVVDLYLKRECMDMGGSSGEFSREDMYVWEVRMTYIFDNIHNYIGW